MQKIELRTFADDRHTNTFTEDERLLLVVLVTRAFVDIRGHDDFEREQDELTTIIKKLIGGNTSWEADLARMVGIDSSH